MVSTAAADSATRDAKLTAIRRAAIAEFSRNGFAATSMADLAAAAGVSRPALYQWFRNREDLFRSALSLVLEEAMEAALAELDVDGPLGERLDGFLQRYIGDLHEAMATSAFGAEIIDAKLAVAADVSEPIQRHLHKGLDRFLRTRTDDGAVRTRVAELVMLAPLGLKADHPTTAVLRRRLTSLAHAAAALVATAGR